LRHEPWIARRSGVENIGLAHLRRPVLRLRGGFTSAGVKIAPYLGTIICNGLFAAGLPAIMKVRRERSLGALNPLPFAMVMGNCLAWGSYGLFTRDPFIYLGNAPGILVGLFMFSTGVRYGTPEQVALLEAVCLGMAAAVIASAGLMSLVLPTPELCATLAVSIANAFMIAFFAAPLGSLVEILRSRDASSLCAPMIAMGFLNGALWCTYGLGTGKFGVAAPNAIAALLSAVQLALAFAFRRTADVSSGYLLEPDTAPPAAYVPLVDVDVEGS